MNLYRGFAPLTILIFIAGISVLAGGGYMLLGKNALTDNPVTSQSQTPTPPSSVGLATTTNESKGQVQSDNSQSSSTTPPPIESGNPKPTSGASPASNVTTVYRIPTLTEPVGWLKGTDTTSTTYGGIHYKAPEKGTSGMPVASISIVIAKSGPNPPSKANISGPNFKNVHESVTTVSAVPAQMFEYDAEVPQLNLTFHTWLLHFSVDGYSYTVSGMYEKGTGDKYAPVINAAMDSVELP